MSKKNKWRRRGQLEFKRESGKANAARANSQSGVRAMQSLDSIAGAIGFLIAFALAAFCLAC